MSACIIVLMLSIAYVASPSIREMVNVATSHKTESYTELYFTEPDGLPKKITGANQQVRVKFSILNRGVVGRRYDYRVVVRSDDAQLSTNETKGYTTVEEGATKEVETEVILPTFSKRASVTVELADTDQTIHFWVSQEGTNGGT